MNVNKNSSLLEKYSTKEDIIFKNQNDEGTLLLLEKPKENTQILKDIGFDHHINEVESKAHIKNSKVVISQLFGKPSFLGSEIKKLCNDYDLVISKVANYKGAPFQDLPEIIQTFMDVNSTDVIIPEKTKSEKVYFKDSTCINLNTNEDIDKEYPHEDSDGRYKRVYITIPEKIEKKSKIKTSYSNWFIMVPREAFNANKKNTCCTLFYRDNDDSKDIHEKDVFTEVYSWGNTYSDFRKYNYFLKYIDWQKETLLRDKYLSKEEMSYQYTSLLLHLFFILGFSVVFIWSIKFALIMQFLIFISLFLSIRKPCKSYYDLWKI